MSEFNLTVPVVFCVFKRLDTTKKVFEKIREAKPQKLYIVADSAREQVTGEKEKVAAVRNYIEQHIDWECEVHKNYASENMGCGRRICSGISWVFETEEEAIILEDDCVPDPSFFRYCQEMLAHYRNDERIMLISGNNPLASCYHSKEEYLFSKIPFIWGWATWKRAWKLYDYDMKTLPENRKNPVFKKVFPLRAYWVYMAEFESLYRHAFDTWDYQLMYAGILYDKMNIVPAESHVFNIGFQEESTHTNKTPKWLKQEVRPIRFPLRHRADVMWDRAFDRRYFIKANKHGHIVKLKQILGLDINKSVFEK
ncbi:MAG: hypothetical protein K2K70_03405 [Lachnospiraceae bacterium]|nr:hypothetical protein [Lachnospiraceae bacterium]